MSGGWRRLLRLLLAPALWLAGLALIVLGNAIGGLALVMAGWFVRMAQRATQRRDELERLVEGVTVGEVMETEALAVAPQATLDTFADDLQGDGTTVARVVRDGALVGLLGPGELERVPRSRWAEVHAGDVMVPVDGLPVLRPGDPLRPAAEQLGAGAAPGLPVVDGGQTVGVLTRLGVGRDLDRRVAAGRSGGEERRWSSDERDGAA